MSGARVDFDQANRIGLGQIKSWLPNGRPEGAEWVALNPTRNDERPGSFKINLQTGTWADFATGDKGGDAVSLYAYLHKLEQVEAARAILGQSAGSDAGGNGSGKEKPLAWILPVPADREAEVHAAARAPWTVEKWGEWVGAWQYRDAAGRLKKIVVRYNRTDGGKDVIPWGLTAEGPRAGDPLKAGPSPLYNLPALAAAPADAPVLLVEGERCSDVAIEFLKEAGLPHIAMTWPGGCKAVGKADWSPLRGRRVLLWPDKDQPGREAVQEIKNRLQAIGCKVSILEPPAQLGEGEDIADLNREGWTAARIADFIEAATQAQHRFKLLRADKLEVRKPCYLIDRMVETDCTGQVYGDVESFKTFVIVGMGCCVSSGTPFYNLPVQKGLVILIIGEGESGITRRLKAWQIANKVSLEGQPLYVSAQAAAMTENRCIEQIVESVDDIVAQHGPPALIIVDTLSRNFGAGSENDPEDMGAYVVNTNLLRERWRCTVLSVHHPGQAAKERSRGHYAFIGSLDFSYRCEKDETGVMRFECQKMKDAPHPPPMAFRFAEVQLGLQDDQGREVTSGVLVQTAYEPPSKEGKAGRGKWQTCALEALETALQKHRKNVEESGRDPDTARISIEDWKNTCHKAGMPRNRFYEVRKTLREGGFTREEYGFVDLL